MNWNNNPRLRSVVILLLLTAFIPMAIYLGFGSLTPAYRLFFLPVDPGDILIYFLIGFLGHALLQTQYGDADLNLMVLGVVVGHLVYPIDILPFLIQDLTGSLPRHSIGWLMDILSAVLGIYAYLYRDDLIRMIRKAR